MNKEQFKELLRDTFIELLPQLRESNPKFDGFLIKHGIDEKYIKSQSCQTFINLYKTSYGDDIKLYIENPTDEYNTFMRNLQKVLN